MHHISIRSKTSKSYRLNISASFSEASVWGCSAKKVFLKVSHYLHEYNSVSLWILCNLYEQLFLREHLRWFTSALYQYLSKLLLRRSLVILFTLTHPSQQLNAGLKLVNKKNSSSRQICLKLTIKISKKKF